MFEQKETGVTVINSHSTNLRAVEIATHITNTFMHMRGIASQLGTEQNTGVLLLGPSNGGKSTLTNYLLKKELMKWSNRIHGRRDDRKLGRIYLVDDADPDAAKIGSDNSSETQYTRSYRVELLHDTLTSTLEENHTSASFITVFDTPGLFDTDKTHELPNLLALEYIIKQAKDLKLLLVIDFQEIKTANGETFKKLAAWFSAFLPTSTLHNHPNSIVFLITNWLEEMEHKDVLKEIMGARLALEKSLIKETNLAVQIDLQGAIDFCSFMENTPANNFILVDPVDNGTSRKLILSAIKIMNPVNFDMFEFNTKEKIEFVTSLRINCIESYLSMMRTERIFHQIKKLNDEEDSILLTCTTIDAVIRSAELDKARIKYSDTLLEHKENYTKLEMLLNDKISQLDALNPDEEIVFQTISGDERLLTFLEKMNFIFRKQDIKMSLLMAAAATPMVAIALLTPVSVIAVVGVAVFTVYAASAANTANEYGRSPLTARELPAKRLSISTDPFDIQYTGFEFTKTIELLEPAREISPNKYIHYVINSIHTEAINGKCIVTFATVISELPQESTAICIVGKKKYSPQYEAEITTLTSDIETNKIMRDTHQINIESSERIVEMIQFLKDNPNESDAFLNHLKHRIEVNKALQLPCQEKLISVSHELAAINTILEYIDIPNFSENYKFEYAELKIRLPGIVMPAVASDVPRPSRLSSENNQSFFSVGGIASAGPMLQNTEAQPSLSGI